MNAVTSREEVRALASRLGRELAVDLPPGQVFALVFRADRALARLPHLAPEDRLAATEALTRRVVSSCRVDHAAPAA